MDGPGLSYKAKGPGDPTWIGGVSKCPFPGIDRPSTKLVLPCEVTSALFSAVSKIGNHGARSICFWVSKALLFAISALHASVGPRGRPTTPNPVVSTILICFDLICPVENGQEGAQSHHPGSHARGLWRGQELPGVEGKWRGGVMASAKSSMVLTPRIVHDHDISASIQPGSHIEQPPLPHSLAAASECRAGCNTAAGHVARPGTARESRVQAGP